MIILRGREAVIEEVKMNEVIECLNCKKRLVGKQTKYCSKQCKQYFLLTESRHAYREKTGMSLQSVKGINRKLLLIREMGGGCSICGYNKNISALEFHHVKSELKEFTLDLRTLSNKSDISIKKELDKCILLCSNCHQELHHPHLNINNLS